MSEAPIEAGPNTLKLAEVRRADTANAPYRPAVIYVDHIITALEGEQDTTLLLLSSGVALQINMSLEKFSMRQRLDKAST